MEMMKNIDLLSKHNEGSKKLPHFKQRNIIEYKSNANIFDFYELKRLISFFASVEKKFGNPRFLKYNIHYMNQIQFSDKLTYILLECFLYNEIIIKNKKIAFKIDKFKNTIFTEGVLSSCLRFTDLKDNFQKSFLSDISRYHFRKIVPYDDNDENLDSVSYILSDLFQFLHVCGISEKHAQNAAEISVELIDNALEHSKSDCLIDIDVSQNPYFIPGSESEGEFFAVNIAVVDFSNNVIGEQIGKNLNLESPQNTQYEKLNALYDLHKTYFCETYTKDHFYMISAFQNKISSRNNSGCTGGKGLTKLIKELQESSVSNICYVASDDKCLFFIKEYIKQDENKWVGFNEQNNCELPPSEHAFKKSPLNIIGTAYNLTFVFKKENGNG